MSAATESVRVVVRCRPFNEREKNQKEASIIDVVESTGVVSIANPKGARSLTSTNVMGSSGNLADASASRTFKFDNTFGSDSKQIDLYNITARPIVDAVLEGYNGTIFA